MTDSPTRDTLLGGELVLWQPPRGAGYRFNLDPVLLSSFVSPANRGLDLGAGCGVLGLLLLKLAKAQAITAVEVQPTLAALALKNGVENGYGDRFQVLQGDLRSLALPSVDAVVFNPPYFRANSGRLPPDEGRRIGRYETHGTLHDFVAAAARVVSPQGHLAGILPMARAAELAQALAQHGFGNVRERFVVPRVGAAARFLLWEAMRGMRACDREAPLVVHAAEGRAFSDEVRALLRE